MRTNLGQYYTQDHISKLLVSKIFIDKPKNIIELGSGDGSLVKAAQLRWKNSKIIGGDIDKNNVVNLQTEFPDLNFFMINGLSSKLSKDLNLSYGSVDVGICNPPYLKIKKNKEIGTIIKESNLGSLDDYKIITSDLVFLSQNLRLIRENGELGIILPDGLITSHQFENFRKKLIQNYYVRGIIELPEKVFKKTEAKTHILIVKKCIKPSYKVKLYKADKKGNIIDRILVNKDDLYYRMDYSYHLWKKNNLLTKGNSFTDIGVEIIRGKFSKKELENLGVNYIHTSDLGNNFVSKKFHQNKKLEKKHTIAVSGDIIIPRVGKRCLDKILLIDEGEVFISDCLYILRAPKAYRNKIINALTSDYGRNWIKAHSHGVCAKVISKSDLKTFLVPNII